MQIKMNEHMRFIISNFFSILYLLIKGFRFVDWEKDTEKVAKILKSKRVQILYTYAYLQHDFSRMREFEFGRSTYVSYSSTSWRLTYVSCFDSRTGIEEGRSVEVAIRKAHSGQYGLKHFAPKMYKILKTPSKGKQGYESDD